MLSTLKWSKYDIRECSDTFGRVPYVPDFNISSGNSEDKTGSVPETRKVIRRTEQQDQEPLLPVLLSLPDWNHTAGMIRQRHDLLTSHQIPDFTCAIYKYKTGE